MLRKRGIKVVSITEHADDSPTGKLMEAIIESVDEFYSENLYRVYETDSLATPLVYPESTEGRPWGQPLKKLEGAPLNLG